MDNHSFCTPRNCNIMQLLPFLLDTDTDEELTISPSKLMYELQMSTEERLDRLCRPTRKYRITTEINTFSRTPDIVVFQNFKENIAYQTTLSLLNLHQVSRHLRIIRSSSPYFKINYPAEDSSMKVAPGMSYTFNITFLPLEKRDYKYEITFLTDGETFKVSLYGIGPRPLLNLPDHIELPKTAVRVTSEKSLILHNYGKAPASFVVTRQVPFEVHPSKDTLQPGAMMELKILCKPLALGSIKDHFDFSYGDIKVRVTLTCEVKNANIYLEKNSLVFENTYMGLKNQMIVAVHNDSMYTIDFQWKMYKSYAIDKLETSKMVQRIERLNELEKKKCNKLEVMNIIDYEGHCSICDRTFEDEISELERNNTHLYKNSTFDILPLTGHILSHQSSTFTIVFSPIKNEHYESWAYLDVTGREDRLSLNLRGLGIGPYVVFNVKVLNINDVFICATHQYEVVAKNEGHIPATVIFKENLTDFGGTITCSPKKVHLSTQKVCEAFIISFYSKIQGKFLERIEFTIKQSGEILHIVFIGNVVCPLLKLNVKEIDFGIVPFGFKRHTEFSLVNDSQVPIDFNLKIEADRNKMINVDECNIVQFVPDSGIVDAYSNEAVQVELAAGAVEEVDDQLKVNMWGSKRYSISLPLRYNCICPEIICSPPKIYIKFCFLDYEYKRTIMLTNSSDVPGFITYTPIIEQSEHDSGILCVLNKTAFMIHPYEKLQIEVSIKVMILGLQEFPLMFTLAGSKPEEMCRILCNGQGPVVSYTPDELDFGQIVLLNNVSEVLSLVNDAPIKATMQIAMSAQSVFKIDVEEVEIEPEDVYNLCVSTYLTDTGKYKGTINVNIINGEKMKINVFGVGVGYSIQCDPILIPEYNAQTLLTYQEFVLPVTFSNLGSKFYQIRWCRSEFMKNLMDPDIDNPRAQYNFRIVPDCFGLESNELKTFEVRGLSRKPQMAQEQFYCHATIEKSSMVNLIMSFTIKANFIEPDVVVSKPELSFLVSDQEEKLEDFVTFTNETVVPLKIDFYTSSNYFLINEDETAASYIHCEIESQGVFSTKIKYVPDFEERRYVKQLGELTIDYMKHPKSTKLLLTTVICYPTVKLIPSEHDFRCLPLNSYSYANVIIQNITYLPVTYRWEFLEDFFELEDLPKTEISVPELTFSASESSSEEENEEVDCFPEEEVDINLEAPKEDEIVGPMPVEEIKVIWEKEQYITELKKILAPVIEEHRSDDNSDMIEKRKDEEEEEPKTYKMSDILSIEPYEGYLEPYEYGILTVGFFPPPNKRVKAKAICHIEDGEHETLTMSGICSKISYFMDKTNVELGRKVFCEICSAKIHLTNTGHCCFNFFIKCHDVNENNVVLEPGWLNVKPKSKYLHPGEVVILHIKYFPGIAGEFYTNFLIQIGYLEPMAIKLHGFAVFAQLHVAIPRPSIHDQTLEVLYNAVSTLSMNYLHTLEVLNNINIPPYYSVPGCPADIPDVNCKLLKKDGWVIISKNDIYPSQMDMDLSIERMLVQQHLITKENVLLNHTFNRKILTIPGFVTSPYILDFGYIMLDTRVCYTVLLLNYGPVKTIAKILEVRNSTLSHNQFRIEYRMKQIKVGEIVELFVLFSPTEKRYTNLDEFVKDELSLMVRHGATIPIKITATVTLPRLVFEHACVDFGAVKLGDCLRRSIIIYNNGYVLSKWSAGVHMKRKYVKDVYFIRPYQGKLGPGRKQLIDIYFVPVVQGFAPAEIIVYIEGSSETSLLKLCGNGIEATLAFSQNYLDFKSTLPYSQNNSIPLLIQNVSTSPIEFCFTDFDQEYEEEKVWIATFLNYYNLKRVFIPLRAAGDKLPDIFHGNYMSLLSKLRQKLMDDQRDEAGELENFNDPLENRSPEEIIQLIQERVESKQIEKDIVSTDHLKARDNFFLSMTVVEPEKLVEADPKDQRPGILIIFHGGPLTEYFKPSSRAGITLSLPVYSIDRLIYECLVEDGSISSNSINEKLNEAFAAAAEEEDITPVLGDDEYDKLCKKVFVVLTKKPIKKGGKGKSKGPDKKDSDKKSSESGKKGGKQKITDTIIDIPFDLFCNILSVKLKTFTNGLIIESLNSDFLRKSHIALNCLLCSIGNIKHIQLVVLSYTLKDYLKDEEERIIKEEEERLAELLANPPKESAKKKGAKDKEGGKSATTSSKSSKVSKTKKGKPNYAKQILKEMPPPLKMEFDAFEELMKTILQLHEFWDRRNGIVAKAADNKAVKPSKIDMKASTKDSTKESRVSTRKKRASTVSADTKHYLVPEETGITFWLLNKSQKDRPIDFTEIICQSLRSSIELKHAKEEIEESLKEHIVETSDMFSVIPKLKGRNKTISDLFVISNCETITEKGDNEVFAVVASNTSLETRRRRKSSSISSKKRQSFEQESITSSITEGKEDVFNPRCVLQPGDIAQYRFAFYPKINGIYDCNFSVEIIGLKTVHLIKCHAICEIPRIDFNPDVVFPRTLDNYRDKCFYDNFVYIKDENVLDFGSVLYHPLVSYTYECALLLKNITQLLCEIRAELTGSFQYSLKSDSLIINPGCEDNLVVRIIPNSADFINATLLISTKNNPKVEMIKLVTKPCKLEFAIKPKSISFDKVALNHSVVRKLTLINSSPISLWWKFTEIEWALEVFEISEIENTMGPYSIADINFMYTPVLEQVILKRNLEIQVFDLSLSNEVPVFTDILTLQANSVEYNVEYEDHIDLGEVKGGIAKKFTFTIANKTKAPVCIMISQITTIDLDSEIRELFKVANQNTTIQAQKTFTANILFTPTKDLDFKEVPIFECSFLEYDDREKIIKSFLFKVSAVVFMSSVELCPETEIQFGYQKILTSKKQVLEIKNNGKFPFEYWIVSLKQELAPQNKGKAKGKAKSKASDKSSKTKSKSSKGSKKSKEKRPKARKPTKLNVDGFSIISSTGEIQPNEMVEVQVECTPRALKEYEEVIIVYVSEPKEHEISGKYVTLRVTGCEPSLNFTDFHKMFKEQFVVDKMENFICPKNIGCHCIFVSSEATLHFKRVCINSSCTSNICVQNVGHVIAKVTARITDTNYGVFKVSPEDFDIDPYSTEVISVTFTPNSIEEFDRKLEIVCDSSSNHSFVLSLNGEGLIPQTTLTEPGTNEDGEYIINFIPTYIGFTRSRKISFKNGGLLCSKVIIEIINNVNDMFSLVASDETITLMNISESEEVQNAKYSTLVNLQPGQTADFDLLFKPTREQIINSEIKIHTVKNPFELIKLTVKAQSYYHNIFVEGLSPKTDDDNCGFNIGYDLDFGFSIINSMQKRYFIIKNNSPIDIYKFEFAKFSQLTFIPRVGHLKPFASKEIIVTFSAKQSVYLNKLIECTLNKIQYVNREPEGLSWDERQTLTPWDAPCLKVSKDALSELNKASLEEAEGVEIEREESKADNIFEAKYLRQDDRPEPEIIVIAGTSEVIPMYFAIIVDYASYTVPDCDVYEINFPDTFLKQKSESTFKIENNGAIPLQIDWNISNYEIIPTLPDEKTINVTTCALDHDMPEESTHSSTLFSSECCCCSKEEPIYPFSITPQATSIPPGRNQTFSVFFTPTNVSQYSARLMSNIVCLHPRLINLTLKLFATSLMPMYYFDIEDSDYMNRRPEGLETCRSDYYIDAKIIEFESLGVRIPSVRKFDLVNPTNEVISYKFESLEKIPRFSYFGCKTPSGFVLDNKKTEIIVTFEPQEFGSFESYYMFHLLGKDMDIPFLLAGTCRPPHVYFTTSHVEIQPTVLSVETSTSIVLRNEEDVELGFSFNEDSLFNESHDQQLGVSPMCGKILPKADFNVCLTYLAEKTGDVCFYIICCIERAKVSLHLNVTAKCLEVLSSVTYVNKEGKVVTLLKKKENIINFGNVNPKKPDNIQFTITNMGQTGFFYNWHFNKKPIEHLFEFSMDNKKGFLASQNESKTTMILEALRRSSLRDFKVKLNISYGPTYILNIHATAEKPLCSFSFREFNFGYCIVQKRKTNYYNVGLEFKNFGIRLLTLENCFVNNEDLTVDFKSAQVPPCFSQHISIYFHPRELGPYKISIPFIVDSIKYVIKIKGEAVKVDLQLVSPSDKYIDLGAVMVGDSKQYTVQVINQTPTNVNVFFDLWEMLPFQSRPKERLESVIKIPEIPPPVKKEKKGKKDKSSKSSKSTKSKKSDKKDKKSKDTKSKDKKSSKTSKKSDKSTKGKGKKKKGKEKEPEEPPIELPPKKTILDFLKISPKDCLKIEPNKKCNFTIEFHPTERLENFSKQIFYETQDHVEPLCIIRGSCIAPDFSLNKNSLTFANVVVGCRHTLNVILKNTGDIKGRFKWSVDKDANIFKISPKDGFISPSSELKLWISFEPRIVECLYKANAMCVIDNVEKPLELMLMGNSIKIPTPTAILSLVCPVREKTEQNVTISNPTNNLWTIYPIISSKHFSTLKEIKIQPNSSYHLTITYCPKQMTTLNPHNGVLFLPLPDGQAIVYQLTGSTLPPLPIEKYEIEINCKRNHTEVLSIKNWLPVKQSFRVTTELISTITTKSLYKVSGSEFVELFPDERKEYLWSIYVINEIPLSFKVIFTDTETQEYMFYEISLKVVPSGALETVDLVTCIREIAKATIELQNPIDLPVNFAIECNAPNLAFEKAVLIPPYSTHDLELEYSPLKTEALTATLIAKCAELGTFTYCLNLIANTPVSEATVKFKAELGEKSSKAVYFNNTFHSPVDFHAMFDYPVFSMEKLPSIAVGEIGKITFTYEPSQVGILQSKAILTSPVTGDYIYPLVGTCNPPSPKGPFFVKAGGSVSLNFVNPFGEQKTFCYNIDSNAFFLKTPKELLKPKRLNKIIVSMQPTKDLDMDKSTGNFTAKLVVNCEDAEFEDIKWVYYICGNL